MHTLIFVSLSLFLLGPVPIITSSLTPQDVTVVNGLREFTTVFYGDQYDYFLSNNPATVEDAAKACSSIGQNFHLATFETETEYRRLLPYLRSFENIKLIWTSGMKFIDSTTNKSEYVWTQPLPIFHMNYTNFPSSSMLLKLFSLQDRAIKGNSSKKDLPRCKNGFLTPKCNPGKCNVTLAPCTTITPDCTITQEKPCSIIRPDCGASCNNCSIEPPVCHIVQEPCRVTTRPCKPMKPSCTILTPKCETVRPPCIVTNPPCEMTTPKPCTTTTRRPCSTTREACTTTQPPCSGGNCAPPVTFCKPMFKCEVEPEICQPGAILCPPPIVNCPPEQTVCKPPELICTQPPLDCPEPDVHCPDPKAQCSPPKITCDAQEVNCPGIVVNCPNPDHHCPSAIVACPDPHVECDSFITCEYPEPPPPCPSTNPDEFIDDSDEEAVDHSNPSPIVPEVECDDCLSAGCIALRKETDFKWKLQSCTEKLHFICEGR